MPHQDDEIRDCQAAHHCERQQKGPADAGATGKHPERQRGEHTGNSQHGVEAQEEQQAEQGSRDRREERIVVDVRPAECQQRRKHQCLHHDFGVRVTREPDLNDVERQEGGGSPGGGRAGEAFAREVQRQCAEKSPRADCAPRSGEAVEAVADRDGSREQVGKLADDRAGVRVLDQEPHEPEAVVVRALI